MQHLSGGLLLKLMTFAMIVCCGRDSLTFVKMMS
jgi:hypothetical protein